MATAAQVAEFRQANQALVSLAQRDLSEFWSALNLSSDPVRIREELLGFFPDLMQGYGDTAAVLGADWYDLLRDVPPSAKSFQAVLASSADAEQAQSTVRWAVGPLFESTETIWETDPRTGLEVATGTRVVPANPDAALSRLFGATQRLVLQPGRDSIWDSAAADPVRTGVARVPSGVTTCKFCVMLASRGPVYRSQVNAEVVVGRGSNRTGYDATGKRLRGGIGGGVKQRGTREIGKKFHDDCDCVSVVIRSTADYPDGYDPDALYEIYQRGHGIGRDVPADEEPAHAAMA